MTGHGDPAVDASDPPASSAPGPDPSPPSLAGTARLRPAPIALTDRIGPAWIGRSERTASPVLVRLVPSAGRPTDQVLADAQAATRQSFAQVVPVLAAGQDDQLRTWVATPLIGPSLVDELRDGPLVLGASVHVGLGIARALAAVHATRAHGGVRPSAVWLDDEHPGAWIDPPVLAPIVTVDPRGPAPLHVPPEVLRGEPWTPASDLWSLGSVLHLCLEGRAPFAREAAEGSASLLARQTSGAPPDWHRPALPRPLTMLVDDLLVADPSQRPEVAEVVAELTAVAGTVSAAAAATAGASRSGVGESDGQGPDGDGRDADARSVSVGDAIEDGAPSDPDPATGDELETLPPAATSAVDLTRDVDGPAKALGSRYVLTDPIGSGTTGRVYRGYRRDTHAPVAVKVLRPELSEDPALIGRFLRERTVLLHLDHPALVRVLDLVVEGSTLAIVMELVDGIDLRRFLTVNGGGGQDPVLVRDLLGQLSAGLAAVHRGGVVHRDVKPENVLVVSDERGAPAVRLTDFGIAWVDEAETLTRITDLLGTPAYLAPETIDGRDTGPAADVYALGIIGYELLAGVRPFPATGGAASLRARRDATPPPLDGSDPALEAIVLACLATDPAARPEAAHLAAWLAPGYQPEDPGPPARDPSPPAHIDIAGRPDGHAEPPIDGASPADPAATADAPDEVDETETRITSRPIPAAVPLATAAPTRRRALVALAVVVVIGLGLGVAIALRAGDATDDVALLDPPGSVVPAPAPAARVVDVRIDGLDRTATGDLVVTIPELANLPADQNAAVRAVVAVPGQEPTAAAALATDANGDGFIDHLTFAAPRGSCVRILVPPPADGLRLPNGEPVPDATACKEVDL